MISPCFVVSCVRGSWTVTFWAYFAPQSGLIAVLMRRGGTSATSCSSHRAVLLWALEARVVGVRPTTTNGALVSGARRRICRVR